MVPGVACRHRRAREPESIQCSCRSCETDSLVINCASHVDVTPSPSSKTIVFPVSATTVGTEVGQVANILACFVTLVPLYLWSERVQMGPVTAATLDLKS